LVLDRYSAPRKAARLLQDEHPDGFEVEWLPTYAPEVNAVEMLWKHTKYGDLANSLREDITHLRRCVTTSMENTRSQTQLTPSFFRYGELRQ
jgi:transposase